jgi:hypothetical protein
VTYVPTLMVMAQRNQRFYQSAQNPKGQHTLVVTNIIGGCDPYFIDYFIVQTGDASSTTITAPSTTRVSASSSNSGSEQQQSPWTAIIAGSTSAALACILFLGLCLFIRRRKRRNSAGVSNELSGKYLSTSLFPYFCLI